MKLLISLAVAFCLAVPGMASTDLKDIEVSRHGDSVYVDITTTKPCLYEHFMIKDAPEKIVVDLKTTINDWTQKSFSDLPFNSIERIRTSQFQVDPELVTRVVLDINRPIGYTVEQLPLGVRIKIPAADNELQFEPWSASAKPTMVVKKIAQKPEQTAPKTAPKATPVKPAETPKVMTKVEDFPKRKAITYKVASSRDPFKPLVGQGANLLAGQVPAVENLTMVGVFDDENGMKALFEDSEGNGFILRANDHVQNGYLVSIQKDKAIFQITEYGWTRTVALNLQMPELK
jgi:hypothetical protein